MRTPGPIDQGTDLFERSLSALKAQMGLFKANVCGCHVARLIPVWGTFQADGANWILETWYCLMNQPSLHTRTRVRWVGST